MYIQIPKQKKVTTTHLLVQYIIAYQVLMTTCRSQQQVRIDPYTCSQKTFRNLIASTHLLVRQEGYIIIIMSKIYHMHIVPCTIPQNRCKESFQNCCGNYLICCKLYAQWMPQIHVQLIYQSTAYLVFHVLNKITIFMDLMWLFCQAMKIPARQWQSTRLHRAKS